jgi:hypothetical protein
MSQVLGLKSLLPLWEKGFRDEGKRFVSQLGARLGRSPSMISRDSILTNALYSP